MNINSTKESKDNLSSDPLNINSSFKNFINLILTLGFMAGLSFCSLYFCNWYGCNSLSSFFRADLLCNACVDASYHLKINTAGHKLSFGYDGKFNDNSEDMNFELTISDTSRFSGAVDFINKSNRGII